MTNKGIFRELPMIPYTRKLRREKLSRLEWRISIRGDLHCSISVDLDKAIILRKHSRLSEEPRKPREFSPADVFSYSVISKRHAHA